MKTKQKSLKVLEITIEDKTQFFNYIKKNRLLIRSFLLEIDGLDDEVELFLKEQNIAYIDINLLKEYNLYKKKSDTGLNELLRGTKNDSKDKIVIDKMIRSGEEIEEDVDLVILGRINSGSRVICSKNIEVFNEIDGTVIANGDYMIIKSIGSGSVMFRGEIFDRDSFEKEYIYLYFDDGVKIKEI